MQNRSRFEPPEIIAMMVLALILIEGIALSAPQWLPGNEIAAFAFRLAAGVLAVMPKGILVRLVIGAVVICLGVLLRAATRRDDRRLD